VPGRPSARRVGRLVASIDFERVLGARSRAATAHFSAHHLDAPPSGRANPLGRAPASKLSTIEEPARALPVEDFSPAAPPPPLWIGAVVPKRHARRAVTRSLIKRQIYAATERYRDRLAPGLWIVRLRAPFDPGRFASAASSALRLAARSELDALLVAASTRPER
jgi:ribonuclease P protein component